MRATLWITMLAFTAIVPGGVAGILAHARRWSPARCKSVARRGGWAILILCGLAAWIMGVQYPFGWVGAPWGEEAALLSQLVWMGVADVAPRFIAPKIAFPRVRA